MSRPLHLPSAMTIITTQMLLAAPDVFRSPFTYHTGHSRILNSLMRRLHSHWGSKIAFRIQAGKAFLNDHCV